MLGCKGFKNMIGNFCKVLFILDSSQIWKLSLYSSRLLWMLSSKMCGHSILIHIWHCEVSHAHIRCNTTPYTAHALTLAIDNSWKKNHPYIGWKTRRKVFSTFEPLSSRKNIQFFWNDVARDGKFGSMVKLTEGCCLFRSCLKLLTLSRVFYPDYRPVKWCNFCLFSGLSTQRSAITGETRPQHAIVLISRYSVPIQNRQVVQIRQATLLEHLLGLFHSFKLTLLCFSRQSMREGDSHALRLA